MEQATTVSPGWKQTTTEFGIIYTSETGIEVKADMGKVWPANFSVQIYGNKINSLMSFSNVGTAFAYTGVSEINNDIPCMETTLIEAQELAEDTVKRMGIENMKA